jgi:cellulose synthase/poly-beta-1,6-N-acetylglucosamine synthase-like glycosyltransferase
MRCAEIIVATDGAVEDCTDLARTQNAIVVQVPSDGRGPAGPAAARNRAAERATGDILIFVDADVVPAPDALPRFERLLQAEPRVVAVFGAYDRNPLEPNFMSQYRNLLHTYVHEMGKPKASTFWAGLGAVRTASFRAAGGFDERFRRSSVEDIDLGYRLARSGSILRLDAASRGRHLKRWTLWSTVVTDILGRGIPWTQLIHRFEALSDDLNTSVALRYSVVVTYAGLGALVAAPLIMPWAPILAAGFVASLVALNFPCYRWFRERRGLWFAVRVVPVHSLHHVCNGVSAAVGTALYVGGRLGLSLPGVLPRDSWEPSVHASAATSRRRS